jgi:hypothetical protein
LICAYAGPLLREWRPSLLRPRLLLAAILVVALATPEKVLSSVKFVREFTELQARAREQNGEDTGRGETKTWRTRLAKFVALKTLADDVKRAPGARSLQTLEAMGLSRHPQAAVFVPPENVAFWTFYDDCRAVPFLVPALLGAPMIRGINPSALKCPNEPAYGYPAYNADSVSQTSTDSELCTRATAWGLNKVFILSTPTAGRELDCSVASDRK